MRKLALLLAATAAMLAMTTSAASAQNVRVTAEATGADCPQVSPGDSSEFPADSAVTGGCVTHVVNTEGLVVLRAHIFGVESTDFDCTQEFTPRIGGNGEGYFTDIALVGPNCIRQPCGTAAGAPEAWEIHIEETTATTARVELHLCIESVDGGGRQTCHLFIPLREDPAGSHRYEMGTTDASDAPTEMACEGFTGFRAEFAGHWEFESSALEVVHLL